MPTSALTSLEVSLDLLERAIGYARGALARVTPQLLTRQTPCSEWDLLALLQHMDDSLLVLLEATDQGYVELSPSPRTAPTDQLLARIRARACAVLGGWTRQDGAALVSVAGSPLTAGLVAGAGALEIAVHGWDVARTCGRAGTPPAALAEPLGRMVPLLVDDGDRPARFAPIRPVRGDVTPGERLLALVGRDGSDRL